LSVGGAELDFKLDVSVTLQADMEPNSVTFTLNAAMLQPIVALLGHTNSPHSTNSEFHCRYLSHIRGRDGVMASLSIRPAALKGPKGVCSRKIEAAPLFSG
jgi:hypothetical protein